MFDNYSKRHLQSNNLKTNIRKIKYSIKSRLDNRHGKNVLAEININRSTGKRKLAGKVVSNICKKISFLGIVKFQYYLRKNQYSSVRHVQFNQMSLHSLNSNQFYQNNELKH